ncbi:MAG: hypothetical protein LBU83_11610 [Bacteroidales bacterium]|nr:hypothetical protein [Bacteroidales bacterium]
MTKKPAPNLRFGATAAVTPQIILCKIARLSPAGSAVKPPLRQAGDSVVDRNVKLKNVKLDKIKFL